MVTPKSQFLIDATFILERISKAFLGTLLLPAGESDYTFAFGCLRDILRLRRNLGVNSGVIVIGGDSYSPIRSDNVGDLISILNDLKIPHIHDPLNSALGIIGQLRCGFSHIITADSRCLQFCTDDLTVVLVREGKQTDWEWISSEDLKREMGLEPTHIPTYFALTHPTNPMVLTNKQAIRLIELYGSIESIYGNIDKLGSGLVRRTLVECETKIRQLYLTTLFESEKRLMFGSTNKKDSLRNLDTPNHRQVLVKYGFPSLLALLGARLEGLPGPQRAKAGADSYLVVVDRENLKKLEAIVSASKLCSIDTESDDKDPRLATLLGVSLSVKDGEAYFIPLVETDLKGLSRIDVLEVLRGICDSEIDFIGHNIKYDYLILRRVGVTIRHIHFDTMLAAYDCHGDWPFFNLPYVCKHYLGKEIKSYSDVATNGKSFLDLPLKDMVSHACQDADVTLKLYPVLMAELEDKGISRSYFDQSIKELRRLANLEYVGMALDQAKLEGIKANLLAEIVRLRSDISSLAGINVDIDSQQAILDVLRGFANLHGYVGPRRLTVSALEHLATVEPIARLIVKAKRLRSQVVRLEAISAAAGDGKVRPLFNQIKSRAGLIATTGPSVFDIEALPKIRSCFDSTVRGLFVDTKVSMRLLAEASNDPVLMTVTASKSKVDPVIAKHPLMLDIDPDELFLRLAVGQTDTVLSKGFLVDRERLATLRHDIEHRYQTMFQWLSSFRRSARTNGFATNGDQRKYIDGLKSADVARRSKAMEYAVRWLIRY